MAVETANLVHAIAGVFCGNPPHLVLNYGVTAIRRASIGIFVLTLKEKLDGNIDGLCQVTPSAGTPRFVSAVLSSYDPLNPDDNIVLSTFDEAGDPADAGEVTLVVYHLPTIA